MASLLGKRARDRKRQSGYARAVSPHETAPPSIDFYFDLVCPWAYLASLQIEELAREAGATLRLVPTLLGGVFRAIGAPDQPGLVGSPAKQAYGARDLARAAARFGVTLSFPADHPRRTVIALRALIASGDTARAMHALYAAYWSGRDVSRPEVVREALDAAGLDGADAVARAESEAIKAALRANTDEAVREGAFGVPTIVVRAGGERELLWGVDRLDFVRRRFGIAPRIGGRRAGSASGSAAPPRAIELFFDYASPYAYLASTQLRGLIERAGVTLTLTPILLGALFRNLGTPNVPLFAMSDAKRAYQGEELSRWSRRWHVPLKFPSRFPMNTVKALRGTLLIPEAKRLEAMERVFTAYWVHDRDIGDDTVLSELFDPLSEDGPIVPRLAQKKEALIATTARAEAEGVFGVPTFSLGGELYFGQDRLDWIEERYTSERSAM